jgi:single-strand DNA-binding protein
MANLNKTMLIGRLTRDPEMRAFASGGRVAKFGFAVNNRRKNSQTGEWEDEPMFIECEAFNRGETGKLADIVERFCKKGSQVYIEGRLHLDTWDDKTTGQKRQKHKLVVEVLQLLDPKPDGAGGPRPARAPGAAAPPSGDNYGYEEPPAGGDDPNIPF